MSNKQVAIILAIAMALLTLGVYKTLQNNTPSTLPTMVSPTNTIPPIVPPLPKDDENEAEND